MADAAIFPETTDAKTPESTKLTSMVAELAEDYSKYLKIDVTAEKAAVEDEIEDILTRLDEFTSLVDMVRGDTTLCLNGTLPEIYKKTDEIEKMFLKIDRLQEFVQIISQNLDVMEDKVNEAEQHLNSSSMKKLLTSIQKPLFSKKTEEPKKIFKYEPPEIFKTEDYLPNVNNSTLSTEPEET